LAHRRHGVAPAVDEGMEPIVEARPVGAALLGEPLHVATVQAHAIDVAADRAALGAGEIGPAVLLVGSQDAPHLPLALGERRDELAVPVVAVHVLPTGSFRSPE